MTEISISDFYRIGQNAVKLSPPGPACLQLQAFRVLQEERATEVGTENLGAVATDRGSPFFWSRKWHLSKYNPNSISFDWPILTMCELGNVKSGRAFFSGGKRCYTIEIAVLDIYREDCTNGKQSGCAARPVNQIYLDTEVLLDSVLLLIGKTVVATTSADPTEKVYHLPALEADLAENDITFQIKYDLGNTLGAANPTVNFDRIERPQQKVYGTSCQIVFCTQNCGTVPFLTQIDDYGVLAFEVGCKDCQ